MKKILIIEEFIPHTGGGRTEKFVKYLRDYSWEPIILTTRRNTFPFSEEVFRKYYPKDLQIHKVFKFPSFYFLSRISLDSVGRFINKFFYFPDTSIGWIPFALIKGANIIKKEKIQVIYTSSPNESTHLIGYFLKKISSIKWVADFRDLWTLHPQRYFPTEFHLLLSKMLEKTFYDKCDIIVTCNEPIKDLISNHFNIDLSKINVITNGFDPEDYEVNFEKDLKAFRIGYMGNFKVFGRGNLLLNFLKAFSLFISNIENKESNKIVLNLWSKHDKKVDEIIKELNIREDVIFNSLIPHIEVIHQLLQQDLLILLTSTKNDILIKTESTQKLLNYIATGIPILAIGAENGIAANIIRDTNTGFVCGSDSIDQIALFLTEAYRKWEEGTLKISPNRLEIEKYDRRDLTKKLAQIFNQLTI